MKKKREFWEDIGMKPPPAKKTAASPRQADPNQLQAQQVSQKQAFESLHFICLAYALQRLGAVWTFRVALHLLLPQRWNNSATALQHAQEQLRANAVKTFLAALSQEGPGPTHGAASTEEVGDGGDAQGDAGPSTGSQQADTDAKGS